MALPMTTRAVITQRTENVITRDVLLVLLTVLALSMKPFRLAAPGTSRTTTQPMDIVTQVS